MRRHDRARGDRAPGCPNRRDGVRCRGHARAAGPASKVAAFSAARQGASEHTVKKGRSPRFEERTMKRTVLFSIAVAAGVLWITTHAQQAAPKIRTLTEQEIADLLVGSSIQGTRNGDSGRM